MEERFRLRLKLSLEEMCLRRVVINLWNETDVLDSVAKLLLDEIPEDDYGEPSQIHLDKQKMEWRSTVENEVKSKMAELVLPESLKKRMLPMVRPIGLQIRNWKIFMESYLSDPQKYLDICFFQLLCWTSAASIDYQKTAENIVRLKKFDAETRYKLACSFCLADFIPVLWDELPQDYKKSFRDETNLMRYFELPMEFYWNYVLKGRDYRLKETFEKFYPDRNLSFHQYAFLRSACIGNTGATEYFLQKLTSKERDDCLMRTIHDVAVKRCNPGVRFDSFKFPQRNLSDVLHSLLSVMSPERQMVVIKAFPAEILPCLLDWPWHGLFSDVADFVFSFLSEAKYGQLAHYIHRNIGNEGCYFPNLIQTFFLSSPSYFRRLFLWDFHSWFPELSYEDDTETIKVIIGNIDLEYRVQLVSSKWFLQLVKGLIKADKWLLVEQCLREADLSKEERRNLRNGFHSYMLENFEGEKQRHARIRLTRCFSLLDETDKSASKMRSSEINH